MINIKTLNNINNIINSTPGVSQNINNGKGEIFVVGGPIRDLVNENIPKDIDFLVRNLELKTIEKVVDKLGKANEVGQSFGIVKAMIDKEEYDFAIPRTKETKTGNNHTDFEVQTSPTAKTQDDLGRRDFTWNAMAVPLNIFIKAINNNNPKNVIIEYINNNKHADPFNGLQDLLNNTLNTVGDANDRFNEDPLRMLRAIQFSCRMNIDISDKVAKDIKNNKLLLTNVSDERIMEEFKKAWTKGKNRGRINHFINMLNKTSLFEMFFNNHLNINTNVDFNEMDNEDIPIAMMITLSQNEYNYNNTLLKNSIKKSKMLTILLDAANNIDNEINMTKNNFKQSISILKQKKQMNFLKDVFKQIDPNNIEIIEKCETFPINTKDLSDLDIGGKYLQSIGFEGKTIGEIQRWMLNQIWKQNHLPSIDDIKNMVIKQYK